MYFEKFPTFFYDFEIDSKKERVTYAITDITRNIRFRRDVLSNITVFDSLLKRKFNIIFPANTCPFGNSHPSPKSNVINFEAPLIKIVFATHSGLPPIFE